MMPVPEQVFSVLREFNPWWVGRRPEGLPTWRRSAFGQLREAIAWSPSNRAVLLGGARQVGKTTLFRQLIVDLLDAGVQPASIVYVTLDHPILRLAGLDATLRCWEEGQPPPAGPRYLFIDEIQHHAGWQTWVKHQVDFRANQRIALTGSAFRVAGDEPESALGRITRLRLPTLSFYEYLRLMEIETPEIPLVRSLAEAGDLGGTDRTRAIAGAEALAPTFHEYLLRGGFPGSAREPGIEAAQRRLREDIVDVALKRDMTAIFGVRHVQHLDKVFLYLCFNDGGILSPKQVASSLEINVPKLNDYLGVLEASHLIHRLRPSGYGKQVLRAGEKVYLADPAIPGAIMLKGRSLLEDAQQLGRAVENAMFKHLASHDLGVDVRVSYWQNAKQVEVDIIAETRGVAAPFEIKYRANPATDQLRAYCETNRPDRAYLIARDASSLSSRAFDTELPTRLVTVPAALACYWLGQIERSHTSGLDRPDW